MLGIGERQKEAIRADFNKSIFIDFAGAKITSDAGFLLMREVDQRFGIIESGCNQLVDERSTSHKRHTYEQMIRQRVYQIAAGYEDCNDADHLRIDPALRLALDKGHQFGASQSVMSRLENDILGTAPGQEALDAMITRSTDALLKRKNKKRLILDVDSTEDPAHGKQEHMAYNGHFGKNCFHPLFCFTSDGDGLAANEARLKMGFLAYNLLHLIRRFYLWGEDTRRSIEWIIMRLDQGGRSDRLSRQVLVCACCVGFSIGAPLPGCPWLATLRWHVL
jgi:hypothetical protein